MCSKVDGKSGTADWYTNCDDIKGIVNDARSAFRSGKTMSLEWRKEQLAQLYKMMDENDEAITTAVGADLHKHPVETRLTESEGVKGDCCLHIAKLDEWAAPQRVKTRKFLHSLDKPTLRADPLGVVCIISAWNYPIQLTLLPMVGAISAGNCAVIKPSELSVNTAKLLADLLPKYLDPDCFKVVNGAVAETTELLKQRFDHILYTGNPFVGKIVAKAAAEYLTPVSLELGGKSPAIVDKNVDVTIAARRIAWGRFLNSGQTCIAPDYVMCHPDIKDQLVQEMKKAVTEYWGENPQESDSFGRIVNERHFHRVKRLLDDSDGKIQFGGQTDEKDKYIAPTVITDVSKESKIMTEEIFGPLLPMITVDNVNQAIEHVNDREKPLALYVFSNDKKFSEQVLSRTSSGQAVVNDTLMQAAVPELPFGGVGNSGTGAYHGKHSFDMFSHSKPYLLKDLGMEFANGIRYPPYTAKKEGWLNFLMGSKLKRGGGLPYRSIILVMLLAFAAHLYSANNILGFGLMAALIVYFFK